MRQLPRSWRPVRRHGWLLLAALALTGCGGGDESAAGAQLQGGSADTAGAASRQQAAQKSPGGGNTELAGTGYLDAVRLANQATFGPTDKLVAEIQAQGPRAWVVAQMGLSKSRYRLGGDDAPDKNTSQTDFCYLPPQKDNPNCWRDYYSSDPLLWDFYRNAVRNPDQLRQRVALALSQVLVISSVEVSGTYGLRIYHNNLLDGAFGNYRELLRKVARSPMMGEYLDHVNNDAAAPNENFARELLQLFTLGPCLLDADGELTGGRCRATYNNATVRAYAYALTGWTYPAGGGNRWGCWPEGANCYYLGGDMVPAGGSLRDKESRKLLSDVRVPANTGAVAALDKVLDSLMAHPNMAPFVARHLIQHLVTSNPPPAYVGRVAQAFRTGKYGDIGTGVKGDLAATVAAVLLDGTARATNPGPRFGRLREPVQMFTASIRAIGGDTDGVALGWWQGENVSQHAFRSPSVFNFYPPDTPLSGTDLVGPAFGIHNANTALNRLNYQTMLFDWGGIGPQKDVPGAVGTYLVYDAWMADAADAAALVDRMSRLTTGRVLPEPARAKVIDAVAYFNDRTAPTDWRVQRVRRAGWLVMSAPQNQVVR